MYAYDSIEDIPSDHTVVIRAHGVPKAVYDKMNGREYIDLTCPFLWQRYIKLYRNITKRGIKLLLSAIKPSGSYWNKWLVR